MYSGGTASGINIGTIGRIDTSSQTALAFEWPGNKLSIPYVAIDSFEYSREVKRHLGVLPAIAVGLVKQRQRRGTYSEFPTMMTKISLKWPFSRFRSTCRRP